MERPDHLARSTNADRPVPTQAPGNFSVRNCGKTPVTRTTGTKIASEMLKGRVFEICLADLNKDEDQHYRKIKLQCDEVQGTSCLTQFYGLDFTTDKLRPISETAPIFVGDVVYAAISRSDS